jgi:hypothetical protein
MRFNQTVAQADARQALAPILAEVCADLTLAEGSAELADLN